MLQVCVRDRHVRCLSDAEIAVICIFLHTLARTHSHTQANRHIASKHGTVALFAFSHFQFPHISNIPLMALFEHAHFCIIDKLHRNQGGESYSNIKGRS